MKMNQCLLKTKDEWQVVTWVPLSKLKQKEHGLLGKVYEIVNVYPPTLDLKTQKKNKKGEIIEVVEEVEESVTK
jgi:hypothetical protein